LTGITGGAHFGFGKGVGGLVGGVIIEVTKSTKMAFYYFGLVSFGCGGLYGIVVNILRLVKKSSEVKRSFDVRALLAQGEFVVTSDAVKGVGDGDRDLGAKRMYDMMHKWEAMA
jgi:hypothetical protein